MLYNKYFLLNNKLIWLNVRISSYCERCRKDALLDVARGEGKLLRRTALRVEI